MATPQLEDGYTQIANGILEAFARIRISGEVWQCINVILRKTYGFKKTEDWISLSQFEKATMTIGEDGKPIDGTGMKRSSICRALNKGIKMNIISKNNNEYPVKYGLQKDFSKWVPLPKKVTKKKVNIDNNVNLFDNNVNKINNKETPEPFTIKSIEIDKNVNVGSHNNVSPGSHNKETYKSINIKKDLQKKVVQEKEPLYLKIKRIKKEYNEFVKIKRSVVVEHAQIVFDKPYNDDPFMEYWIKREVNKMRDWIDEKTDKSQNLVNYDSFISDWFKREKPYPAFLSPKDEIIYYQMKGSLNVE